MNAYTYMMRAEDRKLHSQLEWPYLKPREYVAHGDLHAFQVGIISIIQFDYLETMLTYLEIGISDTFGWPRCVSHRFDHSDSSIA